MYIINDFIVKKEDRKPGIQYMYYRIEGDGSINNGTTSQKERYSTKTPPIAEYWYDVSAIMDVSEKARPDNKFHKWLKEVQGIYPIKGRDIFDPNDLSKEEFESYLVMYANDQIGYDTVKELILRGYQNEGGKILIDFINSDKRSFLLEAITGYGKTYTTYYALTKTNIKSIAIVTNRLTVNDAWIKDFRDAHLESQGFALKSEDCTLGNWLFAKRRIILAPSRRNKLFKDKEIDLWISDEAHLNDSSKAANEFYKDKKVLYVTATGDKFTDKTDGYYYVGYIDMANWIEQGLISKDQFIIPMFEFESKFQEWDFGHLAAYTDIQIEELADDVVKKVKNSDIIENSIVKCQGRCKNAHKFYQVAKLAHPEIKWYLAIQTNDKKMHSEVNGKIVKSGKIAIRAFDKDCRKEKDVIHMLVMVSQGKESFSYYDLHNVFHLCDSSSNESFQQLQGRLTREKKNTHTTTAKFYVYSPLVDFCTIIDALYKKECEKKGVLYTQEGFDKFIRLFSVSVDGIPQIMSAVRVLNEISLRGDLLRNSSKSDWAVLNEVFGDIKEKSSVFGEKRLLSDSPGSSTTSSISKTSTKQEDETEEDTEIDRSPKNEIAIKKCFEEVVGNLPFYFRKLEYYKNHLDKLNTNVQKHFTEITKNFKYPEEINDLHSFPTFNFLTTVFNFRDNQKVIDLFSRLSDQVLENILKRLTAARNLPVTELSYGVYSPHTKTKVASGRIEKDVFNQYFIPKIQNFNKNGKILCLRIGIEAVLLLKELGFTDIIYYTDIVAEKFIFDSYGIKCKYVKQVEGKENWEATIEGLDMKFDLIIMNPPYNNNLHIKILNAAIKYLSCEIICLHTAAWLQFPHRPGIQPTLDGKIKDFEIIPFKDANNVFKIDSGKDLIITHLISNGRSLASDDWVKARLNIKNKAVALSIYTKIIAKKVLGKFNERLQDKPSDYSLRINYGVDLGVSHGWIFRATSKNYETACNTDINGHVRFIPCNSDIERRNLWGSILSTFVRYCVLLDESTRLIPLMDDYTKPWDNQRLCTYFGITGYISDTEALPGSEWQEILNTMNIYK